MLVEVNGVVQIEYTEAHDHLIKEVFGDDKTMDDIKKMADEVIGFFPEMDLLPYVCGDYGEEAEFLAEDIITYLTEEVTVISKD